MECIRILHLFVHSLLFLRVCGRPFKDYSNIWCLSFSCRFSRSLPRLSVLTLTPIHAHSCSLPQVLMHEYLGENDNNQTLLESSSQILAEFFKNIQGGEIDNRQQLSALPYCYSVPTLSLYSVFGYI